jgi:hypothetical protein
MKFSHLQYLVRPPLAGSMRYRLEFGSDAKRSKPLPNSRDVRCTEGTRWRRRVFLRIQVSTSLYYRDTNQIHARIGKYIKVV